MTWDLVEQIRMAIEAAERNKNARPAVLMKVGDELWLESGGTAEVTNIILDDNSCAEEADDWKALVARLAKPGPDGKEWLMIPWDIWLEITPKMPDA